MPIESKNIKEDPHVQVLKEAIPLSMEAESLLKVSGKLLNESQLNISEKEAKDFVMVNASLIDDDLQWLGSENVGSVASHQPIRHRTGRVIV